MTKDLRSDGCGGCGRSTRGNERGDVGVGENAGMLRTVEGAL